MGRGWVAAALVALALNVFAACDPTGDTVRRDAPADHPAERAVAETESLSVQALNDFGVSPAVPDTRLTGIGAAFIDVGRGRAGVFAFARPRTPARCLVAAQLRAYVRKGSGPIADELAVYPSLVFDAADKREGDLYGYSGSALDIRPRATLEEEATGSVAWDVTDIVKQSLSGNPFPSMGLRAPKKAPVVLTIRDVDGASPFATATIASAESGEEAPRLVLTRLRTCS